MAVVLWQMAIGSLTEGPIELGLEKDRLFHAFIRPGLEKDQLFSGLEKDQLFHAFIRVYRSRSRALNPSKVQGRVTEFCLIAPYIQQCDPG